MSGDRVWWNCCRWKRRRRRRRRMQGIREMYPLHVKKKVFYNNQLWPFILLLLHSWMGCDKGNFSVIILLKESLSLLLYRDNVHCVGKVWFKVSFTDLWCNTIKKRDGVFLVKFLVISSIVSKETTHRNSHTIITPTQLHTYKNNHKFFLQIAIKT